MISSRRETQSSVGNEKSGQWKPWSQGNGIDCGFLAGTDFRNQTQEGPLCLPQKRARLLIL